MSYKFFQNKSCEYFPCHKTDDEAHFSCLMCYCPLYFCDCGGNFQINEKGVKDCTRCLIPHYHYDIIIDKLKIVLSKQKPSP